MLKSPLFCLIMPSKYTVDIPKRSPKVLRLSEKVEVLNLNNCLLRWLGRTVRTELLPVKRSSRKKKFTLVLLLHFRLPKLQPQCMVSAQLRCKRHLNCGRRDRKTRSVRWQRVVPGSLQPTDFSNGPPETGDTRPLTFSSSFLSYLAQNFKISPIRKPETWSGEFKIASVQVAMAFCTFHCKPKQH